MKKRKLPLRKCVASQEMKPKQELIRIVRSKDGDVTVDQTGKVNGRGAYITLDKECILKAKKKNILSNHLKANVGEDIYEQLLMLAEKETQ